MEHNKTCRGNKNKKLKSNQPFAIRKYLQGMCVTIIKIKCLLIVWIEVCHQKHIPLSQVAIQLTVDWFD
jgi:hypothetical protein